MTALGKLMKAYGKTAVIGFVGIGVLYGATAATMAVEHAAAAPVVRNDMIVLKAHDRTNRDMLEMRTDQMLSGVYTVARMFSANGDISLDGTPSKQVAFDQIMAALRQDKTAEAAFEAATIDGYGGESQAAYDHMSVAHDLTDQDDGIDTFISRINERREYIHRGAALAKDLYTAQTTGDAERTDALISDMRAFAEEGATRFPSFTDGRIGQQIADISAHYEDALKHLDQSKDGHWMGQPSGFTRALGG